MFKLKYIFLIGSIAAIPCSFAADLFESNGSLRKISINDPINATDTIGNFAIFQGDGGWKFEQGSTLSSTGGDRTIPMGTVILNQFISGEMFMRQFITATLGTAGGRSWSGDPCSPNHLYSKNKGRGREDHCVTIDPTEVQIGTRHVTFLSIKATNSSGGRFVAQNLMVNPLFLGSGGTGTGEWSVAGQEASPRKRVLMNKLSVWAESYLDASIKAFDYSQPQDSYSDLPSIRTLLPAVAEFPLDQYSLGFLSAVEDLKHRSGAKALAYFRKSNTVTPYSYFYSLNSQADADKRALDGCKQRRVESDLECQLIPAAAIQSVDAK
jgi:hypothetical protein